MSYYIFRILALSLYAAWLCGIMNGKKRFRHTSEIARLCFWAGSLAVFASVVHAAMT